MPSPPPESKKLERDEDPMVPLSSISAAVFMPADEDRISEPGAILRGDDDDESVGWEEWRTRGPLPAAWACMAQSAAANAGAKTVPTCAHGLSARTGMELLHPGDFKLGGAHHRAVVAAIYSGMPPRPRVSHR